MSTPTLYLVGPSEVARAAQFLRLGAVVVLAPDRATLNAWQAELFTERIPPPPPSARHGLDVDVGARRACWEGADLALTDLEFRILAALSSGAGHAWSFRELRHAGWGDGAPLPDDIHAVRSVVQRIRTKLRMAGATASIGSVRSYGFRLEEEERVVHLKDETGWKEPDDAAPREPGLRVSASS